jgi:eukaryotic translation initiation factor 2C
MMVERLLGEYKMHPRELADANQRLYRSTANVPSLRCEVDLGADEGRPGRKGNTFTIAVKQTSKVRLEMLKAYLTNKAGWDTTVLECMSG